VETIFVLLPLALLIAAIAVGFFIWAARTGQFDDLETPAVRILFDDEEPCPPQAAPPAADSTQPRSHVGGQRQRRDPAPTPPKQSRTLGSPDCHVVNSSGLRGRRIPE
jgi:cbb3-type cytochrome oxidase maturation protein